MKTATYKLNSKSILRLIRTNLIILFLLYVLNYFFFKVYNPTVILITIGQFFILFNGPAIYLLINYYKNNKKTEFSIDKNSNKISIIENGITKEYSLNEVKHSIYNLGKYWQNAIDKNYRIPTIFSDFGYWDLTFDNGDRYYLTTLLQDFLLEEDKVKDTKYRFRLIPYIDKSETEQGIELKPIEYKPKSRTEKLKESYKVKTKEELKYIVENKSKYQKEAIKVAEQILKEKNVG
ncbi:hypothetical protein [Allomuricauda sp. R78024]|uniref:hypothetical protein n=1 Tax=Allomuricauda sp. R78024 TaxID=3093867 RepID=UPI0037CB6CB5